LIYYLTSLNKQKQEEGHDKVEEVKRRILIQYPNISKHDLEFILSLPIEERRAKVTDPPPVIATKEQQEAMEKSINKNKK
jgi:hypothetical protein